MSAISQVLYPIVIVRAVGSGGAGNFPLTIGTSGYFVGRDLTSVTRASTGVYAVNLARVFSLQEVVIRVAVLGTHAGGSGGTAAALTNAQFYVSGGTLPLFNVINVLTFDTAGAVAADLDWTLVMEHTRNIVTAG